jgi:two-component system, chemotaxis family, response regulator Rcp1
MHRLLEVLLVEDNPADVYLISAVLDAGSLPKRISAVPDGQAAIHFLERREPYAEVPSPDLIILDLNLPKISGHEVLAYIKAHPEHRRIPVVVLSSSSRESDVKSAYNSHANCYLSKPSDLDEYYDLVTSIESYWLQQIALC